MSSRQLGVLLIVVAVVCVPFAAGGVLGEGPHGPHGEITGDPVAFPLGMLGCIGAPIVVVAGLVLIVSRPSPPK